MEFCIHNTTFYAKQHLFYKTILEYDKIAAFSLQIIKQTLNEFFHYTFKSRNAFFLHFFYS